MILAGGGDVVDRSLNGPVGRSELVAGFPRTFSVLDFRVVVIIVIANAGRRTRGRLCAEMTKGAESVKRPQSRRLVEEVFEMIIIDCIPVLIGQPPHRVARRRREAAPLAG